MDGEGDKKEILRLVARIHNLQEVQAVRVELGEAGWEEL